MKKIFFTIFSFLIFSLVFFASRSSIFAQTSVPIPVVDSITPTPVDYPLPYPGLLPDNPLYKLKTLRDKIIEFLISDPLKKAEFDLLQSDKRLNASIYLLQANPTKAPLVVETISKGENYVADGISQLHLAKQQGMDTTEMRGKFLQSGRKHLEVIIQIEDEVSSSLETSLKLEEQRVVGFNKMVTSDAPTK